MSCCRELLLIGCCAYVLTCLLLCYAAVISCCDSPLGLFWIVLRKREGCGKVWWPDGGLVLCGGRIENIMFALEAKTGGWVGVIGAEGSEKQLATLRVLRHHYNKSYFVLILLGLFTASDEQAVHTHALTKLSQAGLVRA